MKKLTVFTPTFNRAYCLHVCYESLKSQTNKKFIWLIIDDGSTDNTEELVETWKREDDIEIRYIKQDNQGMHGAHNTAYENIDTELNVCIDSDDCMPIDAVEKILDFWEKHGSDQVSGMIGLDSFKNGEIIGTKMPASIKESTLFDLYNKHDVKGDKKLVYRSELTKKYSYPIFENEKYVGLAYKYHKLDEEFPLLLLNEILCVVEYLPDGSSLNMLKQYRVNPKGFAFYRKELMKLPFADMKFKYRQAIHYVSSSLISKNKNFIKESPSRLLTFLATPLGLILYFLIMSRTKTRLN
ncbi:glycosyltransferase involved in cell wall biosynthesis [Metabacillus crassostreae]|uniref:glycosyltransferase family 2 protein n=1 Tax=Metabacillus crassostreae TaxID=929098 RepID=UPI00195D4B1E|nr:glycosyltransferase family 2 protein [Metabacillus crassostreae]MBM7604655.1 glycosyltransferase involved in cell wall biosynthesis [Metabacillus crassostreae]